MATRQVEEIMSLNDLGIQSGATASELQTLISQGRKGDLFVVKGDSRELVGRLPLAILITALPDQTAMELCTPVKQFLQKSDDLWTGFLAMEDLAGHTLPVVVDSKSMRLVGSVAESDFISAYRLAVEQERDGQEDRETAQSSTD